jgi:hypothetical protein
MGIGWVSAAECETGQVPPPALHPPQTTRPGISSNQKSKIITQNPFSHARQRKERMLGMAYWLWAKRNFHMCPQRLR